MKYLIKKLNLPFKNHKLLKAFKIKYNIFTFRQLAGKSISSNKIAILSSFYKFIPILFEKLGFYRKKNKQKSKQKPYITQNNISFLSQKIRKFKKSPAFKSYRALLTQYKTSSPLSSWKKIIKEYSLSLSLSRVMRVSARLAKKLSPFNSLKLPLSIVSSIANYLNRACLKIKAFIKEKKPKNSTLRINPLKHNYGFAILGVLIVSGIGLIITSGVVKQYAHMQTQIQQAERSIQRTHVMRLLENHMSIPGHCKKTLNQVASDVSDGTNTELTQILSTHGDPLIELGLSQEELRSQYGVEGLTLLQLQCEETGGVQPCKKCSACNCPSVKWSLSLISQSYINGLPSFNRIVQVPLKLTHTGPGDSDFECGYTANGGQVQQGSICDCPAHRPYWTGSQCLPCPGGKVSDGTLPRKNATCVCPSNTPQWNGSQCVACPSNTPQWNGSQCVACPSNTPQWNGSQCVACPSNTPQWNGSQCVACPSNTPQWNGSQCVACPSNTPQWNGSQCVACPSNTPQWNGSQCVACPSNTPQWNGSQCVACPSNTPQWNGSQCVACPSNTPQWNGSSCVNPPPTPPTPPGPVCVNGVDPSYTGPGMRCNCPPGYSRASYPPYSCFSNSLFP